MANAHSTPLSGGCKLPPHRGPVEGYLTQTHGDLHAVIPPQVEQFGVADTARQLSTPDHTVSARWIYQWLARNGYTLTTVVKRGGTDA